jgi:hypothetical protein
MSIDAGSQKSPPYSFICHFCDEIDGCNVRIAIGIICSPKTFLQRETQDGIF